MPTDVASRYDEVVDYLAQQGGAVESPHGRSLTREMAEGLGWSLTELNAALGELEADGRLVRDVRNRRTYRLALTAPPVASAKDELAHAEGPVADEAADVSKRGRLGRRRSKSEPEATGSDPESDAAAEMAAVAPPPTVPDAPEKPSWTPGAPADVKAKKGRLGRKDKAEKAEKPAKAEKPPKPEKPPRPVRSSTGFVYEIRDLPNRWLEPFGGKALSRYKSSADAFDELRRLNRRGGPFVPRVVVRIGPDGSEDIATPGEG